MTEQDPTTEDDQDDTCPHCGAVLDLARALQEERSILKPKSARGG